MPHLIEPSADEHLRVSFLEAMREFEAATGRADAGGLSVADLEGETCLTHHTEGLRDGTALRPGTEPLRCCEWWWVDDEPDGLVYLGRAALTRYPARGHGHLMVSVRPSRRGEGHGTAILTSALPIARAYGADPVRLAADKADMAARRMIEKCGGQLEHEHGSQRRYRFTAST